MTKPINESIDELFVIKQELDDKIDQYKKTQKNKIEQILSQIDGLSICLININRGTIKLSEVNKTEYSWFILIGSRQEVIINTLTTQDKQQLFEANIKEKDFKVLIDSLLNLLQLNADVSSKLNQPVLDFGCYLYEKDKGLNFRYP